MTFDMNSIEVHNLSKKYVINHQSKKPPQTLRELLRFPRNRKDPVTEAANSTQGPETFWALKDISFSVFEGERVAIIGGNGAGKSTLLKILSRITEPTQGKVTIRGKVSSLLEVGTGFHPELTGRENIYLNGAILGMKRSEITAKFDQIVAFSGVEKFIDTPVKHYSSGMYVRLAFSVSAWLDPDILIVDEVLSVGDQAFQRRCAERMKELTGAGRTVLFVSHSMQAVKAMCDTAICLDSGEITFKGSVSDTVAEYKKIIDAQLGDNTVNPRSLCIARCSNRGGNGALRFIELEINGKSFSDEPPNELPAVPFGGELKIAFSFEVLDQGFGDNINLAFAIDSREGLRVFTAVSGWDGRLYSLDESMGRRISARLSIQKISLHTGDYRVSIALIRNGVTQDVVVDAAAFRVDGEVVSGGIPFGEEFGMVKFPVFFS